MATYFTPTFIPSQFHVSGIPAAGYFLHAFDSGASTTPRTLYQDNAGTSAGTRIELDSEGYTQTSGTRHAIWLDSGITYRLELRAADDTTVIWQEDNIAVFGSSETLTRNFATIASATAASLSVGSVIQVKEYATGYGIINALYDVVAAGTGTHDGFEYHSDDGSAGGSAFQLKLRVKGDETCLHAGARRDSATNNDVAMARFAAYCSATRHPFIVPNGPNVNLEYLITEPIEFTAAVDIIGIGSEPPRFVCDDCSFVTYTADAVGASGVKISNIRAATSVRHTTTPNTHYAVRFQGNTSSRPFYNRLYDCFFDGFGVMLDLNWVWELRIQNSNFLNCGKVATAVGICVNNHFSKNNCTGNGIAITLGDGTNTIEGWWIDDNLIDGFEEILSSTGASYLKINDNIFDHVGDGTGLLLTSGTGLPSIGHRIRDNYIAFTGASDEAIRLLNNVSSAENRGSVIKGNEIFSYTGALVKGILSDGTAEDKNTYIANSIESTTADIDNSGATNSKYIANEMTGAGFSTTAICEYVSNTGTLITSETLLKQSIGGRTEYYGTSQPASGSYVRGDYVKNISPAIDGNGMTNAGWIRLTTGSGHVAGTDWALDYRSNNSPAT